MLYLILSIICSALIGNLLILYGKDKNLNILTVFAGNYFLASLFSIIQQKEPLHFDSSLAIYLGIITGFLFLINFIIYQRNIKLNGLSLSVGIMRVSLLIPTLLSIVVFRESVLTLNYIGMIIVILAFTLMTETRSFHNFFWLLFLFVVTGITDSTMKIFDEFGKGKQDQFIFFIFSSALLINIFLLLIKRRKICIKYFVWGMILGIPNQLTTKFFLKSLESIPAAVAYPLLAASVVLICFIADILIWKKRYSIKQRWALLLILCGIILLNLR